MGGSFIKIGFWDPADAAKYRELKVAELTEVGTGAVVPCWVVCPRDTPGFGPTWPSVCPGMEGLALNRSYNQVWLVPKPLYRMNTAYQCRVVFGMEGEPDMELVWTWQTFGPRVFNVQPEGEIDTGIDWALQAVSWTNQQLQTLRRSPSGPPVPFVIRLAAGRYELNSRHVNPGAWLIIEGPTNGEAVLVLGVDEPEGFPLDPIRRIPGATDIEGFDTVFAHKVDDDHAYAWDYQKHKAVFEFGYSPNAGVEHDGGTGVQYIDGRRHLSMRNLTIERKAAGSKGDCHLVGHGTYGSLELDNCRIIGGVDGLFANQHAKPATSMTNISIGPK